MADVPRLADDPRLVYSTYAIAFIPLTFIYALDFINDKWRPIRETRRNGVIQLLVSLPSLGCIIAYIVLQIKNDDHKEAAAAITVACFNIFHVARTIWGLIQLYEFRNWNVYALRCLLQMGYSAPAYDYSDDVKNLMSRVRAWCPCASPSSYAMSSDRSTSTNSASSSPPSESSPSADSASSSSPSNGLASDSVIEKKGSRMMFLLKSFKSKCMLLYAWIMGNMEENRHYFHHPNLSLDEIQRTVDHHMVVNNSLIDNEFSGAVLPVRPVLLSRVKCKESGRLNALSRLVGTCLKSTKPEESAVRWLVSFLAKFGHHWLENTRDLSMNYTGAKTTISRVKLDASRGLAVFASLLTTNGSVDDMGSTEEFASLLSPTSLNCIVPLRYQTSRIEITDRCTLPFQMKGFKSPYVDVQQNDFDFGNHEATIRDAVQDDWHKASLNELDKDRRTAVENTTAAQLACFATLMEEDFMLKDRVEWDPERIVEDAASLVDWNAEDPRIENLLYQLGYDFNKDYTEFFSEIPIRKEFLGTFQWTTNPNRLVFQTSVHVDNILALESGESLATYLEENESFVEPTSPNRKTSVFQDQYELEISRLRSKVLQSPESFPETPRFLGCVFETVRSSLAEWVEKNQQGEIEGWTSSVAPVGVRFRCSKQLLAVFVKDEDEEGDEIDRYVRRRNLFPRLLWEVEAHLHWRLGKDFSRESQDIRESSFLIMLTILGFPSLKLEEHQDRGPLASSGQGEQTIAFQQEFSLTPIGGPQKLHIVLRFDADAEAVSVELHPEDLFFKWQDWKDAFMGRISAQKHWRQTRLLSKRESLREEAFHSKLSSPVKVVSMEELGTEYDFTYWSGWPPWMVQIAQFEMKKLCQFYGTIGQGEEYSQVYAWLYMQFIAYLNAAMDVHFLTTTTPTKLYENGHRALSVGLEEEAMKSFARCIAEHGHRGALKDAVNVVLKKDPVSLDQARVLILRMDVWFNVLLKGTTAEDQVDFEMLAHFYGVLYESTGEFISLIGRALSLFHKGAVDNPVTEEAIEAIESYIICEPDGEYAFNFKFHLSIAHQSIFHVSKDPSQREKAAKYIRALGTSMIAVEERLGISIGYLLEKGSYIGRTTKRKTPLLSFFCVNDAWELSGRLPEMFDRLFVQQSDLQTHKARANQQVKNNGSPFGLGECPAYAIDVYNNILTSEALDDQSCVCEALNRLGMLYHRGAEGISSSSSDAEGRYSEAIDLHNADALCNMGVLKCGNNADGTDVSYLRKSIEGDSSCGMNNLAIAYDVGRGVDRDVFEAEKLYKQAVKSDGNPIAMYNLAILYMCGDPQLQNEENESEGNRMIDELIGAVAELEPLYTLIDQVMKLSMNRKRHMEAVAKWSIGLEEIDDCLAYVKVLECDVTSGVSV